MPDSSHHVFAFSVEKETPTPPLRGAFWNGSIVAMLLIVLGFLSYSLYSLPSFSQGSAKILFKNEKQAERQLELISSNVLLERLATKLDDEGWADIESRAPNSTPVDRFLVNLGLKRDFALTSKKQRIIELLKSGLSFELMAKMPEIKILFTSKNGEIAAQIPNFIVKEYLQMVKSANFIKARQVQSASRATLESFHISYGVGFALMLGGILSGVFLIFMGTIKSQLAVRKLQKAARVEVPKVSAMIAKAHNDSFCQTSANIIAQNFDVPTTMHSAELNILMPRAA